MDFKIKGFCKIYFFLLCSVSTYSAEANTRSIYLPAGDLEQVLQEIALKFGVSFSYDPALIKGKSNVLLNGRYTLEESLKLILTEHNITYELQNNGFILYKKPNKSAQPVIEEITVISSFNQISEELTLAPKNIIDSLSFEEIKRTPSTNLAEAIQQMSGVTITRELGEGKKTSIRGGTPDFSLTTLNGMPVLANNDSPMDSRIQKEKDRSFDLNILPAELFRSVSVNKAYSASSLPGGISGTIELDLINPSDLDDFYFYISPQIGFNDYSTELAKNISSIVSNSWGNWGALASITYSQRSSEEQGANTFRWRNIAFNDVDLSALSQQENDSLKNGDYIIPRGNRYSVWQANHERLGANLSLEYNNEDTHIDLDILTGYLKGNRYEFHVYPRGESSTPIINNLSVITDIEVNEYNELVYANYEQANVSTESRAQSIETTYEQSTLSISKNLTKKLKFNALLGVELSEYNIPYSNKVYTRGVSDVSIDYRKTPYYADIQYSENLESLDMWVFDHGDLEAYGSSNKYYFARVDFNYLVNNTFELQFGADWASHKSKIANKKLNDIALRGDSGASIYLNEVPSDLTITKNPHNKLKWLKLHTNDTLQFFGLDPYRIEQNIGQTSYENEAVTEYSQGLYTSLNISLETWITNVGIRYQSDHITSIKSPLTPITYGVVLPTINAAFSINDDWQMYLGYSKNYSKPTLESLDFYGNAHLTEHSKYVFNPDLKPYISDNTDISFNGQVGANKALGISFFYKDIKDYIVTKLINDNSYNNSSEALIWHDNAERAYQWGSEVSFNYLLKNTYWGFSINASYNEGKVTYYDPATGLPLFKKQLPYLSDVTASGSIFYDSPKALFKLSTVYRGSYIERAGEILIDEDETGFLPTTYFNAFFSYTFMDNWQVKLSAFNLTNEEVRQYSNSNYRASNTTTSGRSVYFGFSYNYK
ncbi:TonB-dependent receptor [Pseudoalteromonas sp. S1727]|uniref:TonB-dependent receptor n=1 Tax=Pseudoalteromonas sp. S1727 TaxID=2066514 RepID=UPI0011086315|nr:TonB-dependent receptor [Pseudoalteromonas sp. S1727]TMN74157.1 TonB-dependent receptor [Pseudoalteromonas sp. S1727]